MRRRTYLALATAGGIQLAGCSRLRDGVGAGDSSGNGAGGTESEHTDFSRDGVTNEDFVRGYVGAAQAHLQAAVDELVSQGNSFGSLDGTGQGPPVVARLDSLSTGPVRDELSKVENDTRRARDRDVEDRNVSSVLSSIVDAIETVTNWLHTVLDAYPPLHELYLEVHYLVQDFDTEGLEADVQPVRTAASDAAIQVDEVVAAADRINRRPSTPTDPPPIESVEAVTIDGIELQTDRVTQELAAGRSVADAVDGMQAGDELFWPARSAYPGAAGEPPESGVFKAAAGAYAEAVPPPVFPASMRVATEFCECYAEQLAYAARMYSTANEYYKFGAPADESASEYVDRAESAVETAQNCTFDWSE